MHSFEAHSNESTCRKSGRLGLEQVPYDHFSIDIFYTAKVMKLVACTKILTFQ